MSNEFQATLLDIHSKEQLIEEMHAIGSTPTGNHIMARKGQTHVIRVDHVSLKAANLLKQEMLAAGGDAAVHRDVAALTLDRSSMLLIATERQFGFVLEKLKAQPFGLKRLGQEVAQVLEAAVNPLKKGKSMLGMKWGERTYIMGILNVTPDSFSDGGHYFDPGQAVEHALRMEAEGADVIDIGGESTRPGYKMISPEEELARILPVIRALRGQLKIPISVDTYKASVAAAALEAGADIINDIWGLKRDPEMAKLAVESRAPVILMHNRQEPAPNEPMHHLIQDIRDSLALAEQAGVSKDQIILDPGIGFGKTYEQNLEVLKRLKELSYLGYPVLLATSRKSVIGNTLGLPADDRVEGTAATVALGVASGADMVRVHDVLAMKRVAAMADAIVRNSK